MKTKHLIICIAAIMAILLCGCEAGNAPGAKYISANEGAPLNLPDYSEYITLGDYKNASYSLPEMYDLDEETFEKELADAIEMEIETTFSEETTAVERTNEPAQEKDTLMITYHGTVDGKPFKGGDSPEGGEEIVLGYSGYPEGFDDAIIGMKKGESKKITVTLPADTTTVSEESVSDGNVAGKEAVYDVTVDKIEYYKIPDLTDEMVQKYTKFQTVDEYMTDLENGIRESYDQTVSSQTINAIMENIVDNSIYTELPQDKIDELVASAMESTEAKAKEAGMSLDDYVGTYMQMSSADAYREYLTERAEQYLKLRIAAYEIAKKEGIKVTQEEFDQYKQSIRDYYGLDANADTSQYESDEDIVFECLMTDITPILIANATKLPAQPAQETDAG